MSIGILNIWHIVVILCMLIILGGALYFSLTHKEKKIRYAMALSATLVVLLVSGFLLIAVEKYTKKVSLSKLDSKRMLNIEKVVYTGYVTNVGNYPIGKVTFEIKLVNKGHVIGKLGDVSFFSPSGWKDFFGGGANILYNKPQVITKSFVVAKDLKPGQSEQFRVYFDFPPYFRSISQFTKVYGH